MVLFAPVVIGPGEISLVLVFRQSLQLKPLIYNAVVENHCFLLLNSGLICEYTQVFFFELYLFFETDNSGKI